MDLCHISPGRQSHSEETLEGWLGQCLGAAASVSHPTWWLQPCVSQQAAVDGVSAAVILMSSSVFPCLLPKIIPWLCLLWGREVGTRWDVTQICLCVALCQPPRNPVRNVCSEKVISAGMWDWNDCSATSHCRGESSFCLVPLV